MRQTFEPPSAASDLRPQLPLAPNGMCQLRERHLNVGSQHRLSSRVGFACPLFPGPLELRWPGTKNRLRQQMLGRNKWGPSSTKPSRSVAPPTRHWNRFVGKYENHILCHLAPVATPQIPVAMGKRDIVKFKGKPFHKKLNKLGASTHRQIKPSPSLHTNEAGSLLGASCCAERH